MLIELLEKHGEYPTNSDVNQETDYDKCLDNENYKKLKAAKGASLITINDTLKGSLMAMFRMNILIYYWGWYGVWWGCYYTNSKKHTEMCSYWGVSWTIGNRTISMWRMWLWCRTWKQLEQTQTVTARMS